MVRGTVIGALLVAVALALFAFMHSGARGVAVCGQDGSGGPGSLSLWPPGAQCTGGMPERTWVSFDADYVGVLLLAAWLLAFALIVVLALRSRARAGGSADVGRRPAGSRR
jgi:hypothetical protein